MSRDKLTVGLVGYGYWGPNLMRNYMELQGADLKWLCDISPDRLAKAKRRYPSVNVTTGYGDILGDPDVEAVLIATPISTHCGLAMEAIRAGRHVFVEKPMTASVEEAHSLIDAAEAAGVTLMVGHTFEYSPPVVRIKEIIEAGELGDIHYISSSRVNLGLHQKDASVIWDLAPHDFSILFSWLGEEPTHVSALGRSCLREYGPDVAFVNLRFGSGTVAEVQISWLSPVKLRRTVIVGSRRMLLYDDTDPVEKVKVFDHRVSMVEPESFGEYQLSYRTGDIVSPRVDTYEPLGAEARHFVECVREGKRPLTDGQSGMRVVRALEHAEASLLRNAALVQCDDRAWPPLDERMTMNEYAGSRSGTSDGPDGSRMA